MVSKLMGGGDKAARAAAAEQSRIARDQSRRATEDAGRDRQRSERGARAARGRAMQTEFRRLKTKLGG